MNFKCICVIATVVGVVCGDVGGKATVPMISAAIPGTNYYPHGLHGRDNYARNLGGFGVYDGIHGNPYNPLLQHYNAAPATGQPGPYTDHQTSNLILRSPGYTGLDSWRTYPYDRN